MPRAHASPLRSAVVATLVAAALGAPSPARADGDAQQQATAQALFDDAVKLVEARGFAEACPKLEEVVRLSPSGLGAKLLLAECYEGAGRLASAWTTYLSVETAAHRVAAADGSPAVHDKATEREKRAHAKAEELRARLSTITVTVPDDVAKVPGLEVRRDGNLIGRALWGTPMPADGGEHAIGATAPGRAAWSTTASVPVERGAVVVKIDAPATTTTTPGAAAAPATPPARSAAATPAPATSGLPAQRWAAIGVGAAGVVGVVIGSVFGARAFSTWSDAKQNHCGGGTVCDEEGLALGDRARSAGTVSTVAFVAGGALVAGGVALWLTAPSPRDAPSTKRGLFVAPRLGAGAAGADLGGTF